MLGKFKGFLLLEDDDSQCKDSFHNINKIPSRLIRWVLVTVGTIFVMLGVIGVFLPLLPTTPLLLLALACYSISSKKFYNWLLNNKLFGNYIKNYIEGKGIPFTTKIFAISLLWITIIFSIVSIVQNLFIRVVLILVAISVTIHILTISNLKVENKDENRLGKS